MNYNYQRRHSTPVRVGNIVIGGREPIAIQSMTNTSTLDTEASARQVATIAGVGGELVRLTTQGVKEAENLENIKRRLADMGVNVPISADVHFNPKAAFAAALTADKVRINPGNFVDAARTFRKLEFTDEEYAGEIQRIRNQFVPFLQICRQNGCAVRLGVNHGSLSDRIMSRYGDTPVGMVESVMEYLRIAREENFEDIIISIKASNTVVMVDTVRLLVEEMDKEDMHFPLHLGVTEAGDAEDGRIKSAVGIGALLHDGIGDTIRVSLSEPPENEIPVARLLCDHVASRSGAPLVKPTRRAHGRQSRDAAAATLRNHPAAHLFPMATSLELDALNAIIEEQSLDSEKSGVKIFSISDPRDLGHLAAQIDEYTAGGGALPVVMSIEYDCDDLDELRVRAGADFGALLLSGYGDGIRVVDAHFDDLTLGRLELDILQAARRRFSKTEFIACPGCGRTLFDLQNTLKEVKKAVAELGIEGLKIGVMGCIVNGPGEMADADYGYVGAGPGRVSIYRGKELITKNIPTSEALPAMLDIIKADKGV